MKNIKVCVNIIWDYPTNLESIEILSTIIRRLSCTGISYIKLDIEKIIGLDSKKCDLFDEICRVNNISWIPIATSIEVINFTRPYYNKSPNGKSGYISAIPSNLIKDYKLIEYVKECADYIILYTGLSSQSQIDKSIDIAQPDILVHEVYEDIKLDYLTYLQHISSEFSKRYATGFTQCNENNVNLLIAASTLGAEFIEYSIKLNESSHLTFSSESNELSYLVHSLDLINNSRGGYEARRLTKNEKLLLTS